MSDVAPDRIGREFYDGSDYFEAEAHLVDPNSSFHQYRLREVLRLADVQPQDRVVDLGCGWGTITFGLSPHVAWVLGVDFSQRSVDFCEARNAEERGVAPTTDKNVSFLCADGGDTGLEPGSFDLAVAADLFEHLYPEDTARVCEEAHRILRPNGRFAVWTPHRGHILEVLKNRNIGLKRDPSHVDYKSMARVKRYLLDAGFVIEKSYYASSHIPGLRVLEGALQGWIPLLRRRISVLARKGP